MSNDLRLDLLKDAIVMSGLDGTVLTQAVQRVVGARIAALDKMIAARDSKAAETDKEKADGPGKTAGAAAAGLIIGAGAALAGKKVIAPGGVDRG